MNLWANKLSAWKAKLSVVSINSQKSEDIHISEKEEIKSNKPLDFNLKNCLTSFFGNDLNST